MIESKEAWVPVWWNRCVYGKLERIKAIAGPKSKSGKTVHVRAWYPGGMVERTIKPENLEPRSASSGGTVNG